jgi:hypothetical protein
MIAMDHAIIFRHRVVATMPYTAAPDGWHAEAPAMTKRPLIAATVRSTSVIHGISATIPVMIPRLRTVAGERYITEPAGRYAEAPAMTKRPLIAATVRSTSVIHGISATIPVIIPRLRTVAGERCIMGRNGTHVTACVITVATRPAAITVHSQTRRVRADKRRKR